MAVKLPLTEKQVTDQCIGYLRAKGFMCFRLHSGTMRGVTGGSFIKLNAKGTPDWIAIDSLYEPGYTKTIFIEVKKSKGGKLSADQLAWHNEAKKRRFVVLVADDFDKFRREVEDLYKSRRGNGICDDPTVPLHLW